MTDKAVVIGLDGAAWHLIDPLLDAGVMPRLKQLKERGASGVLTSTVPTYTPPAWTTAATGVNPGRHGIYGFVAGHAQNEKRRLVNSGMIRSAPVWEMANLQAARVGIYNLPLTYPPRALDGWMVSGMMTPGYGESLKGFTYPKELESAVLEWAPGYLVNVDANWEQDWRDDAVCKRIVASLKQRHTVLSGLLETHPVDIVFSVLEAPDRLQHVYYRYMDTADPAYDSDAGRALREPIAECFAAMDDIVGLLADYAEDRAIVCSDHGFTAWDFSVHTNALLEQWGYLHLKPGARAMQTSLARKMVPIAKRVLPAKLARDAKSKTFAAIDWSNTKAFASPIPQQGLYINLKGREPHGIVEPNDLEALKDEIAARWLELRGPDGERVTDRVYRSEEVFSGDALEGAPDLLPVLRDHRFEIDDEVFHKEPFSDYRQLPRGAHHPDGIVVVTGEGVGAAPDLKAHLSDVTPTLLYLAGLKIPDGLDGTVMTDAFEEQALKDRPVETMPPLSSRQRDDSSPYSEEEEAIIEESLRGLGYL